MIEFAIFQNGANHMPSTEVNDVCFNDASLTETHTARQQTLINQVRQGVLADRLNFDYYFMTEHHFQPEGVEFSPNPLQAETAIAALTKRIRLGQLANILTWHHPIRFAEQIAMLDVISGGRVECGIGRGYQPREAEVLGAAFGSTVQDQEKNRSFYQEAFDIVMKAWTEDSFSHHGEFFTLPPTYTKWHHKQTIEYYNQPGVGRTVDEVLKLGAPDMYSSANLIPILAGTTTLREISVYPQPVQKPHPQIWEPLTSDRSIRWAAQRGINAFFVSEVNSRLRRNIDLYHDESEKHGWPDRLDRGPLKRGWDADQHRGVMVGRWVHVVGDGIGDATRADRALQTQWDWYGPFGYAAVLSEQGEPPRDLHRRVTPDLVREKEIALVGSKDYIIEAIMRIKEECGYDDFAFCSYFEMNGFSGAETEEQMQYFSEEIMPVLRDACGGSPAWPESTVDLDVGVRLRDGV